MTEFEDMPLGYLIQRVHTALRAQVSPVLESLNLAFPEYICMRILSKSPGRSSAELARDTNVSPQAMNMVLRGLQDAGLVARPATVSSGRALPAELTGEGVALLRRAESAVRAAEGRLMANLTDRQRSEFRSILVALGSDPNDRGA
jgi:DNA-binding MarR family transcriptional regulator